MIRCQISRQTFSSASGCRNEIFYVSKIKIQELFYFDIHVTFFCCHAGHPNVRVFMTHGGLFGSSEAAFCGVPVVSTPFYGDQFLNSAAMENRGMGVVLKYQDINKDSVFMALRKTLDPNMRKNAKKVSFSYTHRPMKPKEAAVYWSEYVIATGGAQLTRPHSGDSHWLVYSVLDIYLFIVSVLIAVAWGIGILWQKVFTKKKVQEPKKTLSYRAASMERKIK